MDSGEITLIITAIYYAIDLVINLYQIHNTKKQPPNSSPD